MRVLISGIAGFYGSHLAKYIKANTDWDVVGLDRIDIAGNLNRLRGTKIDFVWHDLKAPINQTLTSQIGDVDIIFHIAAASHVDRSIEDPMSFVMDNVVGTCNILEYARKIRPAMFFYFSTDEVFGPTEGSQKFKEWDRYHAGNPYSATKAGGEELALAYHNTYKLPVVVTHCMNIFASAQNVEKFIPKVIRHLMNEEVVPIYGDEQGTRSGSRNYVYADTVSKALIFLTDNGVPGEKYNIEGNTEITNLELAEKIADILDMKLNYELISCKSVRPGNDFSYGIDGRKLRDMGFKPDENFNQCLTKTVNWYKDNPQWLSL